MKKVLGICLSFVMAMFVLAASAQTQYKGKIVDEAGQPVIGATVIVKGTTSGTTSGIDGSFAIAVPAGAELQVSYIGYITENIADLAKTEIVLKEDKQQIEEDLQAMEPTERVKALFGLLGYVVPKQSAISVDYQTKIETEALTNFLNTAPQEAIEHIAAKVVELHRLTMGNLHLPEDLAVGECRELTEEELKLLQQL